MKTIFNMNPPHGNGPNEDSLGLSSHPYGTPMKTTRFAHATVARLSAALGSGDADAVLAAGALAGSVVAREPDGGARRAASMLEAVLLHAAEQAPETLRARLEDGVDALLAIARRDGHADETQQHLTTLWRDLAVAVSPAPPVPHRLRLEAAVQDHLARHLHARTSLRELARTLGYSPSHISAVVRRVAGCRLTVLRRRMQLERATWLLERGASVKEAASGAGFRDPAYLSRVFRRRFGVPPSRWAAHRAAADPSNDPTSEWLASSDA